MKMLRLGYFEIFIGLVCLASFGAAFPSLNNVTPTAVIIALFILAAGIYFVLFGVKRIIFLSETAIKYSFICASPVPEGDDFRGLVNDLDKLKINFESSMRQYMRVIMNVPDMNFNTAVIIVLETIHPVPIVVALQGFEPLEVKKILEKNNFTDQQANRFIECIRTDLPKQF